MITFSIGIWLDWLSRVVWFRTGSGVRWEHFADAQRYQRIEVRQRQLLRYLHGPQQWVHRLDQRHYKRNQPQFERVSFGFSSFFFFLVQVSLSIVVFFNRSSLCFTIDFCRDEKEERFFHVSVYSSIGWFVFFTEWSGCKPLFNIYVDVVSSPRRQTNNKTINLDFEKLDTISIFTSTGKCLKHLNLTSISQKTLNSFQLSQQWKVNLFFSVSECGAILHFYSKKENIFQLIVSAA